MDTILITGADGFIGSHLTDYFIENNQKVIALKKPNTPIKNLTHLIKNHNQSQTQILSQECTSVDPIH